MLQRTRTGKAIRAVSDNRDLAESSGIDVSRVILNVWLLAGGLAALGGVFFGLAQLVSWDMASGCCCSCSPRSSSAAWARRTG